MLHELLIIFTKKEEILYASFNQLTEMPLGGLVWFVLVPLAALSSTD